MTTSVSIITLFLTILVSFYLLEATFVFINLLQLVNEPILLLL